MSRTIFLSVCRCYLSVAFLFYLPLSAQQTRIYTEPSRLFREAIQRFDEGNYVTALQDFERFEHEAVQGRLPALDDERVTAKYYAALSAIRLQQPDIELRLTSFIDEHGESRYASRIYYELGNIYFDRKSYKDALYCYENVEEGELNEAERSAYFFQTAYSYFVSKKFDKAKGMFAEIINVKNNYYYDANYYYGVLAYFDKQYPKALESFQKIEKDTKYNKAIPYYIALIYFFQNKPKDLLEYAVPKAQMSDLRNQKELNQLIGQAYFNQKKFAEALPYLTFYVEKSSKVRKDDLYQLAYCQYQTQNYEKAIANFSELNTLQDTLGQSAMYNLADCYLKINDKGKAMNAFDAASRLDFDPEIKEISIFNHAKLCYELGFDNTAINRFKHYITQYPNNTRTNEARRLLSEIFETTRNYKDAMDLLENIQAKSPEMQRAYQRVAYLRGAEFMNDRRYDDALTHFDKSLSVSVDRDIAASCQFWKADIAYRKKQYEDAFQSYENFLGAAGGKIISDKISPANAKYSIGYILFKDKEYADARLYFEEAANLLRSNSAANDSRSTLSQIYADALLRNADCHFMLKQYDKALALYDDVLKSGRAGSDYAYYQKGMLLGLTGDANKKIEYLSSLENKFPGSSYTDDALYQTALTQVSIEQFPAAIASHKKLIDSYPESEFVRKSLVNLGLIYFNTNDYERSLQFYELVITRFPKSVEAQEALDGVRDLYVSKGDADGYITFVKKFPDIKVSVSAQDSLSYQIAENYYSKADCNNAVKEFTRYLTNFPNGAYVLYARFYRGQCLYSQQSYAQASKDYEYIVNEPNNIFTEQALDKGSRLALYIDKNYERAYLYARKLYETASRKELRLEALRTLIRSTFHLQKGDELDTYTDLLRRFEGVTEEDITDTYFYLGMLAYQKGNTERAKQNLLQTAQRTTNEKGAQARYYLAEMAFKAKQYDAAKDLAFKVINETASQEYWVVKAFILLADIYTLKGDTFQAKATLQSILDNYKPEDDLKKEARTKLNELQKKEASKSKLQQDEKPKDGKSKYLETDGN